MLHSLGQSVGCIEILVQQVAKTMQIKIVRNFFDLLYGQGYITMAKIQKQAALMRSKKKTLSLPSNQSCKRATCYPTNVNTDY